MQFDVRMIPALTAALLLGLASAASGQATSNSRMPAGANGKIAIADARQTAPAKPPAQSVLGIQILSNRADLISGGHALVQIVPSGGGYGSISKIDLNGIAS